MHALMRILALLLLSSLIVSCEQPGEESQRSLASTKSAPESFVIDVPSLLGRDAQEVRKIIEATHGKPDLFNKPRSKARFGTLSWRLDEVWFSFDFHRDGAIGARRDGTFVLSGFESKGHTVDSVLRACNLYRNARDYVLEIDEGGGMIVVSVVPAG